MAALSPAEALQRALAQLEALRPALGPAAVDAASEALRSHVGAAAGGGPQRLRQVSVLFADVADSTAMLGRVGPEHAMDLLGRAVQDFADAVHAWGGEVLRYTGDGVKAAFGVRGLREDEAERAVRAGLRMLELATARAAAIHAELGVEGFGVRVGIHTGPVLLGGGPEAERSAMGHAVHLAARMEQSAPVGQLRVSDATWAQVEGLFRAEPQPPLLVKGHAEPLHTWLVTAAETAPDAAVARGVRGITTPLVGRDAELARLTGLHAAARRSGRLHALLVTGEAGLGKTRLRRELLATLGLRDGQPGLLQARAHPSTPLQPYGLLRQLVARWLDIGDDRPVAAARQRLVDGLAPLLGDNGPMRAARLGALLGLDFSGDEAVEALAPGALREQGFDTLREALFAHARQTSLLVVLDDLHWADDGSLAFVRRLLDAAEVPLALLLLARPALFERAGALASAPGFELPVVPLQALDGAGGRQLLQALLAPLPQVPAALEALLLERAAGNPFFLEALVRMLIDDGVIDADVIPWRLNAERLSTLRVPGTLVGVLQARLDALPAAALTALQSASIIGPVFWDAALAAIDGPAPAALPGLATRALVQPRADSAFSGTAEHAFVHQLLHDTTYDTVLKEQRSAGHARAADWLAARVGDRSSEFLALTAQHYERAGDSGRALHFWDRARADAGRRGAYGAALSFIERALAQPALVDPRFRFHLLNTRCTMYDGLGDHAAADASLQTAAAFAHAQDDNAMRADVLQQQMLQADHEGRPRDAQALAERIVALDAQAPGDYAAGAAALAHGELAWLALQRQQFHAIPPHIRAGVERARVCARVPPQHGGFDGYEHQLRAIEITALLDEQRFVDALRAVGEAMAALGPNGRPRDRWSLWQRESLALAALGRLDDAAACAVRMHAFTLSRGLARLHQQSLEALAGAAWLQGRLDDCAQFVAECARAAGAIDAGFDVPLVRELQGRLAEAGGDDRGARTLWREAAEGYVAQGREGSAWTVLAAAARVEVRLGLAPEARAAVEQVLCAAEQVGRAQLRALVPEAVLDCCEALAALDDPRAEELRGYLRVRLQEQLAALPDDAARTVLLRNVPHWRHVAQQFGAG